jgi:aminopeptidase N
MKSKILLILTVLISVHTFGQIVQYEASELYENKQSFSTKDFNSFYYDDYDINFYFLDVNVERTSTDISGVVEIHATITASQIDTFFFEVKHYMLIDSVTINGIPHTAIHDSNLVKVPLIASLGQNGSIISEIFYHGSPSSAGFFGGITSDTSPTWGNSVTWTLSEPYNAINWWPCKQDLKDKADSAWIFITTDTSNLAGSNGLLTQVQNLGNGKHRFEWKTNYPIDYYLISLAVSDYQEYNIYAHPANYNDSILIQNYIYSNPAFLPANQSDIDMTIDFIELLSDLYGLYPFADEKYGHCIAPLGGGMEHQTMTTQGNFGYFLTCHELGHQWFGNNVTCASWQDIWINEGFASYTEILCAEYLQSQAAAETRIVDKQNDAMSAPDGSVYVPLNEINDVGRVFSGRLSYRKGASIIHMLRFEMDNDTAFFNTLKNFQQIYKDSVATGEDFKSVAENISGMNLTDFFNQWYYGEGFPSFNILWYQAQDSLYLSSYQSTSTSVTTLFKMSYELKFNLSGGGSTTMRFFQSDSANYHKIYFPFPVSSIEMDPNNWNLDGPANIAAGIHYKELNTFTIFPNPSSNIINLQFADENPNEKEIQVHSISGALLYSEIVYSNMQQLDVSSLSKGIYIIKVVDENGYSSSKKFVKL